MALDIDEGLFRSWAEIQGCTAPGFSTDAGRDSLLVPVLRELLVLLLKVTLKELSQTFCN